MILNPANQINTQSFGRITNFLRRIIHMSIHCFKKNINFCQLIIGIFQETKKKKYCVFLTFGSK